jgi:DNA-binding MarR family transcriptional regulator
MSTNPARISGGRLHDMAQEQLNERETRAWVGFQRMRIEVNEVLARQLARDFGLTEADFVVLLRLSRIPEHRQRARDLAAALHWDRSRLSRQVSRMATRGTLTRAPSEGDARGYDVVMTDAGLTAFEAAWPAWVEGIRHCFADILSPKQLDVLAGIAETIEDHYNSEHCSGGPTGSMEADAEACEEAERVRIG